MYYDHSAEYDHKAWSMMPEHVCRSDQFVCETVKNAAGYALAWTRFLQALPPWPMA